MSDSLEAATSAADARFLAFRGFAMRLGFLVSASPALSLLLHWYLQSTPDRIALLAALTSTAGLLVYPLAIHAGLARLYLPACISVGVLTFMLSIIWALSRIPDGYATDLWLLLYPLLFAPLLSMPFDMRQNWGKVALALLIPLLAAGVIPTFPLLKFCVMALPPLVVILYFRAMVDRVITANHTYRLQIEALANRDALTGCFNRRYFMEDATRQLKQAQRSGRAASLIMLDIDHFKNVNDRFGHATGDLVIRAVAQQLATTLRETDVVARIGGEEFVALLPDTDCAAARTAADRVRLAVAASTVLAAGDGTPVRCTVSLGLALALAEATPCRPCSNAPTKPCTRPNAAVATGWWPAAIRAERSAGMPSAAPAGRDDRWPARCMRGWMARRIGGSADRPHMVARRIRLRDGIVVLSEADPNSVTWSWHGMRQAPGANRSGR
jgi:diguanylate cyclase (GGDEF)-like protein